MEAWWRSIKEKWAALELREQQMLAIGGAVVAVLLFYLVIWLPYLHSVEELRGKVKSAQQTLAWMEMADQRIQAHQQGAKRKQTITTPALMLSVIKKEVVAAGLQSRMKSLKQAAQDSVQIQFQKVDFDQLMQWLIEVMQRYAVTVTQLSVESSGTSGMVEADLTMKPL